MSNKAELAKLTKVWYKKLKKSGFEDIEQSDGKLKEWHSFKFAVGGQNAIQIYAKTKFYDAAREMLTKHTFATARERKIWALYSEGESARGIAKKLKLGRFIVSSTVNRLIKIMVDNGYTKE